MNGRVRVKKKYSKLMRMKEGDIENSLRDSTLLGTSKYLNHTQLKNETDSLSLLNSKNNGFLNRGPKNRMLDLKGSFFLLKKITLYLKRKRYHLRKIGIILKKIILRMWILEI